MTAIRKWAMAVWIAASLSVLAFAANPSAPSDIDILANYSQNITPGAVINTSGGSITEVNFTATTQNYRWKGYVGNITGKLALLDESMNALVSWDLSTISGEVYAIRNSSTIDWSSISCADDTIITTEETNLSVTSSSIDSIRNTFNNKLHDEFYVGANQIPANTCNSTALNVNNTVQSTYFQEVLLTDRQNLIYASLLENSTFGFNNRTYDFQIIVAENAAPGDLPHIPYYFYIELI